MQTVLAFCSQHGLLAMFILVFLRNLGAPLPAFPALLLAGAAGARNLEFAGGTLLVATFASTAGDLVWFFAGRRFGPPALAMLCRFSLTHEGCVQRSMTRFERGGRSAVVVAKFVPGLGLVVPTIAGALGMGVWTFTALDTLGGLLWTGGAIATGLLLHSHLQRLLEALTGFGNLAVALGLAAVVVYAAFRTIRNRQEPLG